MYLNLSCSICKQQKHKFYKPTNSHKTIKLGRKTTGGKYHARRKKRKNERKGQEHIVTLGENKKKRIRTLGGNQKTILLNSTIININENGKTKKAEIKNVIETPQNIFLARQNRLLKSAIVETSLGKARITNRPSKEGQINAVLVKE